jgi:predicted Fe-Mo cluster-binding NifX family protein
MKIAVPTLDERQISPHFGRSKAFLVFDTEGSQIRSLEIRSNTHGHQAHAGQGHEHGQEHGHGHHDHNGFIALLQDCSVVISAGMGPGARHALQGAGMKILLVRPPAMAEAAVLRFLEGRLTEDEAEVCGTHAHP